MSQELIDRKRHKDATLDLKSRAQAPKPTETQLKTKAPTTQTTNGEQRLGPTSGKIQHRPGRGSL